MPMCHITSSSLPRSLVATKSTRLICTLRHRPNQFFGDEVIDQLDKPFTLMCARMKLRVGATGPEPALAAAVQ